MPGVTYNTLTGRVFGSASTEVTDLPEYLAWLEADTTGVSLLAAKDANGNYYLDPGYAINWEVTGAPLVLQSVDQAGQDALTLADSKTAKMQSIDSRTQSLIGQGFFIEQSPGEGVWLSLSGNAQRNWTSWAGAAQHDLDTAGNRITFPFTVSTVLGGYHTFASEQELIDMWEAAQDQIRNWYTSGVALRQQADAQTTPDAVDALVDDRSNLGSGASATQAILFRKNLFMLQSRLRG